MFRTLQAKWPKDTDLPDRAYRLQILTKVLRGQIYDMLPHAFHTEANGAGEYVPLRDRRPSVRYGLCRLVVEDSVSLLFSEGHFPAVVSADEQTREALERLASELLLNEVMIDAAIRGSVGSVAIFLAVLKNRVFIDVMETAFLTPLWDADQPDRLVSVTEQYKVRGTALQDLGFAIENPIQEYWWRQDWTETEEIHYAPVEVSKTEKPVFVRDEKATVKHDLGFVPIVWIKNLPGGDKIDGGCTFPDEAIDTSIEIDYQLSQAGRGLKYSSDPTLLVREPAVGQNGEMIRSAGNALVVSEKGDARMLEINGTAIAAVMDYVVKLREMTIEGLHGNRANADKISAAQSGRAMELMNQALIWLADRLRISYGEGGLLTLLNMIVKASTAFPLVYKDGTKVGELSIKDPISLRWPAWYQPTAQDRNSLAQTLTTLVDGGIVSAETATKVVSADYDIEDTAAERRLVATEMTARNADAQKQVKITE